MSSVQTNVKIKVEFTSVDFIDDFTKAAKPIKVELATITDSQDRPVVALYIDGAKTYIRLDDLKKALGALEWACS